MPYKAFLPEDFQRSLIGFPVSTKFQMGKLARVWGQVEDITIIG